MDEKLRETTNLCFEMVNSKRQVKEKRGHAAHILVCRKRDAQPLYFTNFCFFDSIFSETFAPAVILL